jgi:hypothetical protein
MQESSVNLCYSVEGKPIQCRGGVARLRTASIGRTAPQHSLSAKLLRAGSERAAQMVDFAALYSSTGKVDNSLVNLPNLTHSLYTDILRQWTVGLISARCYLITLTTLY